jgi:hypothetical protein
MTVDETELDQRLREVAVNLREKGARRTELVLSMLADAGTSPGDAQAIVDRGLETGVLVLLGADVVDAGFSGGRL